MARMIALMSVAIRYPSLASTLDPNTKKHAAHAQPRLHQNGRGNKGCGALLICEAADF